MHRALRATGLIAFGAAGVLAAEHYWTTEKWKKGHPLIDHCLDFVIKNPTIQATLGQPIEKTDSFNGVLAPNKPWANLSLEVKGSKGTSKVILMADGKLQSDVDSAEDLLTFNYKRQFSVYDRIKAFFSRSGLVDHQYSWKIISMHAKLNDVTTLPIIVQGRMVKTPKIKESLPVASEKEPVRQEKEEAPVEESQLSNEELAVNRRKKQMMIASNRWKQAMIVLGSLGMSFLVGRHYLKMYPVGRTSFVKQAHEDLKLVNRLRDEVGLPIQAIECAQGYLNYNQTKGTAKVVVYGPKGFASIALTGHLEKTKQKWVYTEMALLKGNQRESLLE